MKRSQCGQQWREPHLLSFVSSGQYVSIHADLAGITMLIDTLEYLREELEKDDCPHTHLFSESLGGVSELSEAKLESEARMNSVIEVKIYGWNEEWAVKHGLKPPISS